MRIAVSLLLVLFGLTVSGPALANCLSGSQARQAVQSGQAVQLGAIAGRLGGEVVKAQLCQQGGRLVYIVGVLQSNGQVVQRVVDARSGRVLR